MLDESKETKLFIEQELKDKILDLVKPEYKVCLQKRFDNVESAKNSEEALEIATEEIASLVKAEIMGVKGGYHYTTRGLLNSERKMTRKIKTDVATEIENKMGWEEYKKMTTKAKRGYSNLTLGSNGNINTVFSSNNIEKAFDTTAEIMFDLSKNIGLKRKKEELDKKLNS